MVGQLLDRHQGVLGEGPAQLRVDHARVQGQGQDAVLLEPPLVGGDAEQHVGDLALAVRLHGVVRLVPQVRVPPRPEEPVVRLLGLGQLRAGLLEVPVAPPHAGHVRRPGADVDDPRGALRAARGCLDQLRQDRAREEPVPDVVGREVQLDPLFGDGALLDAHDARAVHDDVDGGDVGPGQHLGSGSADRVLVGQVDFQNAIVYIGVIRLKCVNGFLDLGWGAASEDEIGRRLRSLHDD